MPVFQETADESRDFRILPSLERPLPRLTPWPIPAEDKYEVVVIGAGPAGLMLTLLLARYGITSLANFDAKPGTLKAGQADGLQPRTLEVLKSLDVVDEILNHGCHMSEVAFWNPKSKTADTKGNPGIERTNFAPDVAVAARYKHEVTIHQGRIERILEENLKMYGGGDVMHRSTRFVGFEIDETEDTEYPLRVDIEEVAEDGTVQPKIVRAKHLVGADGAHSNTRRAMGLSLQGETTDHIWGVADFVADTNFPDVRKRTAIHSEAGSVMIIPRERISSGEYLTRLYVQVKDEVPAEDVEEDKLAAKIKSSKRRAAITLEYILEQAGKVFAPYQIKQKAGTKVDWWAAYQIGQRMSEKFTLADEKGLERVFIVGDACHTHSPKAGQGMNVSMMDSYNLAWKLTHTLHGLTPPSSSSRSTILSTFEHERLTIARQLIDFDTKFSSMFSGQIGSDTMAGLTHDQFLKVFSDGSGFTSGCGIEYPAGVLVQHIAAGRTHPITGDDYLQGAVKTGRRLLNTVVRRYADANLRNLQDDFPSTGRYRLLVFASRSLTTPNSADAKALQKIAEDIVPTFPVDLVELVVLHPFRKREFEWEDIPAYIKELAEMKFHGPADEDVYGIYGVSDERGAVLVVRPDGYVGCVTALEDVEHTREFLKGCLVQI